MEDVRGRYDKIADEIAEGPMDPLERLARDREIVFGLRRKNTELKSRVKDLLENNRKMVELIEILDGKISKLTEDVSKGYSYSFRDGGWIEKGSVNRKNLENVGTSVTPESINSQLEEILKLIRLNKNKT